MNIKHKDLLLIRKFVRRMKGSKHKIVHSQIVERAANLGPYFYLLPGGMIILREPFREPGYFGFRIKTDPHPTWVKEFYFIIGFF